MVAGKDSFYEIYSASTLRRIKVSSCAGRVVSALGTKDFLMIGMTCKQIHIFNLRDLRHVKTVATLQAPTTMCILDDSRQRQSVLIYGLGDDGYGCVYLDEDFKVCESCCGIERNRLSIAKTAMYPACHRQGFICKVGGYTAVTGAGGHQGTKKTSCFIQLLK